MRRFLIVFLFIGIVTTASAQNVQLHYDFGENRNHFTTTVEMFKPDKLGNTFFFIDMDYNVGEVEGMSLAYWEIARAFTLGDSPFAYHAEYNGGFGQWKAGDASGAFTINSSWLTGLEYSWNASDFSKGFTLQALYKYIRGKHDASFQLTGVWYLNFANNKFSFAGFADFWREDMLFASGSTKFVFLSEPQLWFNATEKFAIGSEIEVSSNFVTDGIKFMPTIGAKYTF
ncbi:MAG: DUF5020 family protein [Draconibacterium sp.]|nr:DUF5020 family protein [Draconibacterium sp.]